MADGTVLLDERRGIVYHLNRTGATALSLLLDGGYEATVVVLCARYTITPGIARRDLTRLLAELLARRLVTTS
ncbi:MAG: PqqD family peptide modification chaperone [Pseudonocardiales bacterium]